MKKLLVVALLAALSPDASHAQSADVLRIACQNYRTQLSSAYQRLSDAVLHESLNLRRFRHQLNSALSTAESDLSAIQSGAIIPRLRRNRGRNAALRVLRSHGYDDSIVFHGELSSLAQPSDSSRGYDNITGFKLTSHGTFRTSSGITYFSDSWSTNSERHERNQIRVRIYDSNLPLGSIEYTNADGRLPMTSHDVLRGSVETATELMLENTYPQCRDVRPVSVSTQPEAESVSIEQAAAEEEAAVEPVATPVAPADDGASDVSIDDMKKLPSAYSAK